MTDIDLVVIIIIAGLGVVLLWAQDRAYEAKQKRKAGQYTRISQGYDR